MKRTRTTKIVSMLLAVLLALSCFAIVPASAHEHSSKAPGSQYDYGDVNRDGVVDIMDATLIQKYAIDKADLDDEQKVLGDVNGDGEVDILDATLIQKFAVDKIDKFPVEDITPTEPTTAEPTTAEPTEPAPEGSYYILGTMNNWSVDEDYILKANEAVEGEYVFEGLKLTTSDQFKVGYSVQGAEPKIWYPNGYNNNYGQHGEIQKDGTYTVYFRPDGQGGDDWFYNTLYVAEEEQPQSTTEEVIETTTEEVVETTTEEVVETTTEEPPVGDVYTVAGSSAAIFASPWDAGNTANDMTLNGDGVYAITYTDVQPEDAIQLKVVKNHSWDESYPAENYTFNVVSACDVTVTFDPETKEVNVTGDGVAQDVGLDVYSVIAVGNGSADDPYLNGASWQPSNTDNALTEIADGIWEFSMADIYAFNNYMIKFAVNSIDEQGNPTSNPWAHNFGAEEEKLYPTNTELDAVYNGKNCIFEVEDDGSTVKLQLDLRNFDYTTKAGAKMTITVTPPVEPVTTTTPEEETTTAPVGSDKYYLVGSFTDWEINADYEMFRNTAAEGFEYSLKTNLSANDELKVVMDNGGKAVYYPDGTENNYVVEKDGTYTVYFRPNYDGGEDWYYNCIYLAEETEPGTTAEPVETTTVEQTTAEPGETISVFFTDAQFYGDVNVYYWPNGGDWPGKAMTKTEVNEYGQQIYVAEVPANVDGIIFNGNGKQTVDITEGIAEGAWWYTVPETDEAGHNYVKLVGEQPTDEPGTTAEPTEPGTTAEPGETISVFFTDTQFYGDVNVYYWPNGGEFPGKAMTKTEVNEYGQQVYVAEIPADVDGIIFNGNGRQTVDITEGIADGAWWYTVEKTDEAGHNYVELVGEEPTDEPGTTAEPTEPTPGEGTYYIIGTMTGWAINPDYALTANEAAEGEYMFIGLPLTAGSDQFKIGYSEDGENVTKWYPDGTDNNYGQNGEITETNVYDVYFRPEGQGGEDWFYDCIYVTAEEEPVEPTTGEPTEPGTTAEPGETISVFFTDAQFYGDVNVYYWPNGGEFPGKAMTKTEVNEYGQQIYVAEIPADVDGIIFNGNGKQTVDIIEGIADGAWWYTVPETDEAGHNYVELVGEEPTDEPGTTAEPVETTTVEQTTAEPGETISVFFTDAQFYGDVNVYYWPNGGDWPGKAMTKTEVNEYGQQIYVAEIPADAAGVIFNGNGKQTVDITEGIADGAWWYTVPETDEAGHNYVKLVGEEPGTTVEPGTTAEPTEPTPGEGTYYIIGTMTGWAINADYALTANEAAEGEYMYKGLPLTAGSDQFKIGYSEDGKEITAWYPGGTDNNYGQHGEITETNVYDVYFRPEGQGGEGWFYDCIYVAAEEEPVEPTTGEPTEPGTTAEPTEPGTTAEPGETISVFFTDAQFYGDVNVYYWPNGGDWPGKAMTKTEVNEYGQQIYVAEIPADVDGIIFNGNGKQTVDITEGIAEGAWWYTVPETDEAGHNYVKLVGEEPTDEPGTTAEPTEPGTTAEPIEPGAPTFYLVGTFTDWQCDDAYILTKNAEADGEYMLTDVNLSKSDELKVVETNGSIQGFEPRWYPDNIDNYVIDADGVYDIYFRPNYDGGEDWYGNCLYVADVTPEPTTAEPATGEPTEPGTTGEPAETISVFFTDAQNYGDVNVYYWPDGGEFPGKAMTKTEVNEYGQQIYVAEIPADVEGILFSGDGRQTVDITEGIEDGAWWYTVDKTDERGHNYVELVGEEPGTTVEPGTTAEPTEPTPGEGTYYIIGTMTGWEINPDYALTANEAAEGEYMYKELPLTAGSDQFKIGYSEDGENVTKWYPDGTDNNYGQHGEITETNVYDVYFRPDGQGGEGWFYDCIYVTAEEEPVEPTTTEPTEPAETTGPTGPVETITVYFTDALNWGAANVYYWNNGPEWPGTAMTEVEVNDYNQKVYKAEIPADAEGIIFNGNGNQTVDITTDIADGAQWYTIDQKQDNNYMVVLVTEQTDPSTTAPTDPAETTEPGTTVEPGETITVYFTDALNWGEANVYYWNNGPAWPGTAMTEVEVNDYNQKVYKAEIPADVEGINFNGNGNQTVDITTDIADGAQWYTIDQKQDNNYMVVLVTEQTDPSTTAPTDPVETTEPTEPVETTEPTEPVEPTEPTTNEPAETKTVNVGVINYLTDELSTNGWQVHYWGGATSGDADLTLTGETEQKNVGYWDSAQTFNLFTAAIPADATGFKVHNGDRWFGDDGTVGQKAYVFNYSGDKALYVDETEPTEPTTEEPTEPTTGEPEQEDVYSVAGSSTAIFGAEWDKDSTATVMTKGDDGVYSITFEDVQPEQNVEFKVVKNHSWDTAYPAQNYTFNVTAVSDVTITFDPATSTVNATVTPTGEPEPEPQGTVVKLKPNSNWTQANARFAIYVFNNSTNQNAWADMTAVGDGTYTVTLPEGTWEKVIFVRMNPSTTANNWDNKWNQSADLDIVADKLYTVPSGAWSDWTA